VLVYAMTCNLCGKHLYQLCFLCIYFSNVYALMFIWSTSEECLQAGKRVVFDGKHPIESSCTKGISTNLHAFLVEKIKGKEEEYKKKWAMGLLFFGPASPPLAIYPNCKLHAILKKKLQSLRRRHISSQLAPSALYSRRPGKTAPPAPTRCTSLSALPVHHRRRARLRTALPDERAARGSTPWEMSPPRLICHHRASIRHRGGWRRPSRGRSWPENGAPPLRPLPSPRRTTPTPCAPLSMAYRRCCDEYRN
jgi:hypothetical protein